MELAPATVLDDTAAWQAMLDRHQELFTEMAEGSAVGIVARDGANVLPGRRIAGLREAAETSAAPMLVWRVSSQGVRAEQRGFAGFESAGVDLLFVADDEALDALHESLDGDTLGMLKRLIRRGSVMFYVFRNKYQLQEAGYEEFLDSLGLAFLGACR